MRMIAVSVLLLTIPANAGRTPPCDSFGNYYNHRVVNYGGICIVFYNKSWITTSRFLNYVREPWIVNNNKQ